MKNKLLKVQGNKTILFLPLPFQVGAFVLEVGANVEASSVPATVVVQSKELGCADVGLQCSDEVCETFIL